MKTKLFVVSALALGIGMALVPGVGAQAVPATSRVAVPLGLLRLQDAAKPGDAAKLVTSKFAIDALTASGIAGVSKAQKDNLDTLLLDAGKEWSRSLRGSGRETTFVSFQVYSSQNTVIEVGGARLGLTAGPIPGSLQLMYDDSATGALQWKSLNLHIGTGKFGGKALSALPTLTVALDPAAGYWHLYSGSRLIADHLPLVAARRDTRQFTVKAGTEGAWVTGLVLADENPLYEDANANGVDDAFERKARGVALTVHATLAERQRLAKDWKEAQRATPPPTLFVQRPMPDRPAAATR